MRRLTERQDVTLLVGATQLRCRVVAVTRDEAALRPTVAPADDCVEVVEVVPSSPAERAGLRAEDLILEVDGVAIERVEDLQRVMVSELIGRPVALRLLRHGRPLELDLVPAELEAG